MDIERIELAWAAGFFDGEGHMGMSSKRKRKGGWTYACAVLKVSQCEPTTLHRFREAVGRGTVGGPYAAPKNGLSKRPRWEYSIHGRAAIEVAAKLLPYLSEPKTQQIQHVLDATAQVAADRPAVLEYRQTPKDLDLLRELYWVQGLSGEDCAKALEMSASGLRRWMQKTDYPRRNAAQGRWMTTRRLAAANG